MTKRVTIIDVKDYVGQEVTSCNYVMEQPSSKVWPLNQTF